MPPTMPDRVTVTTPQPATVDPATGKRVTPAPLVVVVRARLSRAPVGNSSQGSDTTAGQDTTLSDWTLLVPAGTHLTAASRVLDSEGRTFEVQGQPARRPDRHPRFLAAAVRLISDMQ
jgi:head-tail adaptor